MSDTPTQKPGLLIFQNTFISSFQSVLSLLTAPFDFLIPIPISPLIVQPSVFTHLLIVARSFFFLHIITLI